MLLTDVFEWLHPSIRFGLFWACQNLRMDELPGSADVAARLRMTALRGFGPDLDSTHGVPWGRDNARITIPWSDCPIPAVLKLALSLIDLEVCGPGEKVAWWVPFVFDGHRFELAHQKFGLRLRLMNDGLEPERVESLLQAVRKKLLASMRIVEKAVNRASGSILDAGDVTVINQHSRLQKAYEYFRNRAINPTRVEDQNTTFGEIGSPEGFFYSFVSGRAVMELNATHDMVAAVIAYISRLEHDLVLALPFVGFDASKDHLADFIGSRWGLKFERVLGPSGEAKTYLNRLGAVVERWRNPYAHGGFEKGHGSTVFVHVPGAGALPIGLNTIRAKPFFSLANASELAIRDVFALFDEVDAWLANTLRHASKWIDSGLAVRFDAEFCATIRSVADKDDRFDAYLSYMEYQQDTIDNMDY
ncbi:hypothetical protein [Aeromicrobium piscarium]|uniref:Uncharacterized protein n=1 Tax=Aeromicrobium piscarium TaxID=2590901 RepID=A0A554RVL2_9ACTN|nr:hypothetical protein [Aeromicrobium piscarium]TSD58154.1 hypothetical protein FNM00_14695 [Aeromicrobium piscarium]